MHRRNFLALMVPVVIGQKIKPPNALPAPRITAVKVTKDGVYLKWTVDKKWR